jgi:hypothetical protein
MPSYLDGRELARLQESLLKPVEWQERRTERLQFDSEQRRFRWTIEQQILIPQLPSEDPHSECYAVVSLGIYPKKRLPDLVAFGPHSERIPVLSRHERTGFLALALLDRKQIRDILKFHIISRQEYLAVVSDVADIIGSSPEEFESVLGRFKARRLYDMSLFEVFEGWWDEFEAAVSELKDWTHVLAVLDCRSGNRYLVTHTFSEEILELKPGHPVGFQSNQLISPEYYRDHLRSDSSIWGRALYFPYLKLSVSQRHLLTVLAQGLCLFPTTAARQTGSAGHCASYYLLVESPGRASNSAIILQSIQLMRMQRFFLAITLRPRLKRMVGVSSIQDPR